MCQQQHDHGDRGQRRKAKARVDGPPCARQDCAITPPRAKNEGDRCVRAQCQPHDDGCMAELGQHRSDQPPGGAMWLGTAPLVGTT